MLINNHNHETKSISTKIYLYIMGGAFTSMIIISLIMLFDDEFMNDSFYL